MGFSEYLQDVTVTAVQKFDCKVALSNKHK